MGAQLILKTRVRELEREISMMENDLEAERVNGNKFSRVRRAERILKSAEKAFIFNTDLLTFVSRRR